MGNTSSASTVPADMKAAVKQLDHERKRLLHVSKSLHAQEEYINQLEDLTMCLEKSLSAYPDADFQLTLIRGLHEKHKKAFTNTLNKWQAETHAFEENPDEFLAENNPNKYKRASFKEKVARRASNIFKSHSKTKQEVHNKLAKRQLEQKKRLEKKLQKRLEEQRRLELNGEKPSKSLKQAVNMLMKQILVFNAKPSQIVPGDGASSTSSTNTNANGNGITNTTNESEQKTRHQIDSGAEIFHPPPGAGKFVGHGVLMNVNQEFVDQHVPVLVKDSPYSMLHKAYTKAFTFLKVHKKQTNLQLTTWVANLNLLIVLVLDKCATLYGSVPTNISQYIDDQFRFIGWEWQTSEEKILNIPKGYVSRNREMLMPWCMSMANHFDEHHQEKLTKGIHNEATDLLYGEGGLHYEEMELTAWEAFKLSQQQQRKEEDPGDGSKEEGGNNDDETKDGQGVPVAHNQKNSAKSNDVKKQVLVQGGETVTGTKSV